MHASSQPNVSHTSSHQLLNSSPFPGSPINEEQVHVSFQPNTIQTAEADRPAHKKVHVSSQPNTIQTAEADRPAHTKVHASSQPNTIQTAEADRPAYTACRLSPIPGSPIRSKCTSPLRRVPSLERATPPAKERAVASLTSSIPWIWWSIRGGKHMLEAVSVFRKFSSMP